MKIILTLLLNLFVLSAGCARQKPAAPADNQPLLKIREEISNGNYADALKSAKDISNQVPPGDNGQEALYLQGYLLAYGKSDFQGARLPLRQLLDVYPGGFYAADAQKLLADCEYWQGHYEKAGREYKKLFSSFGDRGFASYAQIQQGHCLLLDDKVGDALAAYQEIVEKYPAEPAATSAQLMIANAYLKLQNLKQAKTQLRKLMAFTKDPGIQQAAQNALRQIEEEEPFKKGVGVTE